MKKGGPETPMDFILPFRDEDNKAWEMANLLGRILFPIYLVVAACRTIMFWALMIGLIPIFFIVYITEHRIMQNLGAWIERIFNAIFCKTNP